MEQGNLVLSPLEAEDRPDSVVELERLIDERLPYVELSELLIEVDHWTGLASVLNMRQGTNPKGKTSNAASMQPSSARDVISG
jgi:hypothetical protein